MSRLDVYAEVRNLRGLLAKEKEDDLQEYRRRINGKSINEQKKLGVCWYPVKLEKTRFDAGERLLIRISRHAAQNEPHLFQQGKLVNLFSNVQTDDNEDNSVTGVINQVTENEMIITINSNDFPDWLDMGYMGVQLMFDDNSYREMDAALEYMLNTKKENITHLMQVLLGGVDAEFSEEFCFTVPKLNESQNKALNMILNAKDVAIVHGPPGTGKTTTLVQSVLYVLKNEQQVLVCAPSNAAVDLLVEKLFAQGVNVLRIGHPARVTDENLQRTVDVQITKHAEYRNLKSIRKQAEEYKKLGHKYKRNFGPEEREQRKMLLSEARKLREEGDHLEFYITTQILQNAQVIACTLVGAANMLLKGKMFSTVFIDEASQGLEPATWIPILKAQRVVLAGDHKQLPPTVKSREAAKGGLDITLFEKAITRNKADVMLQEQYRMNTKIMAFSGKMFYNDKLFANKLVENHTVFENDEPLVFIDTAGCGYTEMYETESCQNNEEAALLVKHLAKYLDELVYMGLDYVPENIGIISPYRAQVTLLAELINDTPDLTAEQKKRITVNTIDSFQGQERDVIYISLVRSNDEGEIGFLSDIRRMNVAITRARKKLVITGDSATIGNHPFYSSFIDYVNDNAAYRSAFEFI